MENKRNIFIEEVDQLLKNWTQGDYVLEGEHWFVHRYDIARPLTDVSEDTATEEEEIDLAEEEVKGLVVVTQTCDIVRSSTARPFVEVVPLVEVEEQQLSDIKNARRPQYAYIPTAEKYNLVADLDRVMTIEKAVVAKWKRQKGCTNDQEIRALGEALARKRVRFAFPDDFNRFASKLQKRLKDKHSKNSDQGKALRALQEIRVQASPDWNADQIKLMFHFIRDEKKINFERQGWSELLSEWLKLIPKSGRFQKVDGQVITLEDMTAKEYVESDRLDLDHLSSS